MKHNISVTIITLNEEKNIGKCLESLKGLNAQIVIVDSGSKDNTLQIAKNYAAEIFTRPFDDFASQKNYALSKCKNEWVFSVDPDEIISEGLIKEIHEALQAKKYDGYLIGRRNFILGKEIKYSRWSPDQHIWLWKKDSGFWQGKVHEEVIIKGNIGELKNKKIHYQTPTVSEFLNSNNLYSTLEAREKYEKGLKFSLLRMFTDPLFEFVIRYVYKLGFLDAKEGFILAYLMAIYKISVWIKLYELQFNRKQ